MRRAFTLFAFLTVVFSASPGAQADWQGRIHVKMSAEEGHAPKDMSGTIRAKKHLQRMDVESPQKASTIVDMKSKKVLNLLHDQKMYMEMSMDSLAGSNKLPQCSTEDIDACLAKQGFKKSGSGEANGHPCTIYEGKQDADGKKITIKLWRPDKLKEVAAVKSLVTADDGTRAEMNITDIKMVAQADSHFKAPKGYKSLGDMGEMFKKMIPPAKR